MTTGEKDDARSLLKESVAIWACRPELLLSVLWGCTKVPNYHSDVARGYRPPDGPEWAPAREVVDEALFPAYKDEVRWAALSLDGRGVSRFGSCFVELRHEILAKKASVFVENSFFFGLDLAISQVQDRLRNTRAAWSHREYVAVAKLAPGLGSSFSRDEAARKLVVDGLAASDDDFMEVHVFGPLGVESLARVTIPEGDRLRPLIEQECQKHGIAFDARPP
jgi:hypothetical protein